MGRSRHTFIVGARIKVKINMFATNFFIRQLLIVAVFALCVSPALAAGKKALVLGAVGSSRPEAVKSIEDFAEALRKERPDLKIVKAFTSAEIVEKLKDTESETPSLASAISSLAGEGYTDIGVLSLHITPGHNHNFLVNSAAQLESVLGGRVKISVSPPLAGNEQDAFTLASYLIYSLPGEIKPGEAVVFVGRGSDNAGSLVYPALNWALFLQGEKGSLYMVMNLENRESVNQVMQVVKMNRRKVVWVIPLMSVYGATAEKEVFNTDDDSVASRLKDAGHTVRAYKQGLVSNPSVQSMWKSRLKKLMLPSPELEKALEEAKKLEAKEAAAKENADSAE